MMRGVVKAWSDEQGWGLLSSPEVQDDVWVHFTHIESHDGYRSLRPGATVQFDYFKPPGGQDGFVYVATSVSEVDAG